MEYLEKGIDGFGASYLRLLGEDIDTMYLEDGLRLVKLAYEKLQSRLMQDDEYSTGDDIVSDYSDQSFYAARDLLERANNILKFMSIEDK